VGSWQVQTLSSRKLLHGIQHENEDKHEEDRSRESMRRYSTGNMFVQIGYIGLTVGVQFNAEELCDEEIKTRLTVWVSCIPSGEVGLLALH